MTKNIITEAIFIILKVLLSINLFILGINLLINLKVKTTIIIVNKIYIDNKIPLICKEKLTFSF